jgi:hypothetical protein
MSLNGLIREFAARHIPHPQRSILCDTGNLFAVGRDGDAADDVCVASERVPRLQASFDVPYSNGVVPRRAGDATVIGEEGDTSDCVGVASQRSQRTDVVWSAKATGRGEHLECQRNLP